MPDTSAITLQSVSQQSSGATRGPLQALYQTSAGNKTTLLYPLDLGNGTKNHFIKFWIKNIDTSSLVQKLQTTQESFKENGLPTVGSITASPPTVESLATICLYMPDTVQANYNASYDELSLTNDLGDMARNIQFAGTVAQGIAGYAKNKTSQFGTEADLAGLVPLADSFLNGNLSKVVQSKAGFAINPRIQTIFRGVDFRTFQLSFNLTPSSQEEAQAINNIINTFRYHQAPDILNSTNASNGLFFVPPSYFNIEFMFGDAENQYLPRYGDCVLKGMDVNFAPNGFASHIDGAPVQTQLTLEFQEIEIVTKSKLNAGKNVSNSGQTAYNPSQGLR